MSKNQGHYMKNTIYKYLRIWVSFILALSLLTACGKNTEEVWESVENSTTASTTAENRTDESETDKSETENTTESTTEATTENTTKKVETTTKSPTTTKPKTTTPAIKLSVLQQAVKDAAEKYGAVGIQATVISNGQIADTEEYGWAVLNQRKMAADTKIRVASLSKTIVAMVAFRLIEDGKLDLNADISDYIGISVKNPSYPNDIITLEMLLTHTSGLVDANYVNSLEELQNHFSSENAYTKYKPGEKYTYNNFVYGVIGTICEIVTNKSVTSLAKEYFFNPMGITASFVPAQLNSSEMAVLYWTNDSVGRSISAQQNTLSFTDIPGKSMRAYAGGLTISSTDYAKLLTLFMNDGIYNGQQLLSQDSINTMQTVKIIRPDSGAGQCMPMVKYNGLYGENYLFYHTGSAYGVYSLYAYNPDTKMGVVVVTTGALSTKDTSGIYAVCGDIAKTVFKNKNQF